MEPNFVIERRWWQKGFLVVGVDEAGRGALAGPVVAAAVGFPDSRLVEEYLQKAGVNDSKKLTPKKRQELFPLIKKLALTWGIGEGKVGEINRRGIVWATQKAMRQAVQQAIRRLENRFGQNNRLLFLLVDAFHIRYLAGVGLGRQQAIRKGDRISLSVAAASVLAKVWRDRLMVALSQKKRFEVYHWEKNKGYGTEQHRQAITRFGLTPHHRPQFIHRVDSCQRG